MSDTLKVTLKGILNPILFVLGVFVVYEIFSSITGINLSLPISFIIALSPIWLPVVLLYLAYEKWVYYVHLKFVVTNGRFTLRINLPQNVTKSPEAMESVFTQIYNISTPDNLMHMYLDGRHPLTYSFELVSIGGEVRFYINVPSKKIKNALEAQLYAQYPGIEIVEEALDYTDEIVYDPNRYEIFSFHLTKKSDQAYPIKTYIDFNLDKMPKEEEKYDPLSAMIEALSIVKPHERVWVQILATPHAKRDYKNGHLFNSKPSWEKGVQSVIDSIMKRDTRTELDPDEKKQMLTVGERERIAAMERNVGKYAYDTGIRFMYIAEKGKFSADIFTPVLRSFTQFDMLNRNAIGVRWRTDFDYNFISDPSGQRKERYKRNELLDYKLREYKTRDRKKKLDEAKVMSVEELATMFHIPSGSIITPSLPRILSTRKEAPSNLPTGISTGI
jgi:hypothetical protein